MAADLDDWLRLEKNAEESAHRSPQPAKSFDCGGGGGGGVGPVLAMYGVEMPSSRLAKA